MTIIWSMISQIWSAKDKDLLSFWTIFCPFTNRKSKFCKNEKKAWRYYHFTNAYHDNHMTYGSWGMECNEHIFCYFGLFFALLHNQKIKILTKWKKQKQKAWRNYHFTHDVSYDIWFLRNGVQWMDFFVILGYLLPFYPSNNPKTQLKKVKMSGDIIILHTYQKWQPYDVWFLRYGVQRIELFVILDHFLPFYPANNPENQNLEKIKKSWRYYFTRVP